MSVVHSANHTHDEESNVEHKWLLEYSKLMDGLGTPKPLSLALSEFHFLVLMNNMLKVCPFSLDHFPVFGDFLLFLMFLLQLTRNVITGGASESGGIAAFSYFYLLLYLVTSGCCNMQILKNRRSNS